MDWDKRYAASAGYLFGEEPNEFLKRHASLVKPGMKALVIADGDGRNGVWLAKQGAIVTSVDVSQKALEKAGELAVKHGVELKLEYADLLNWNWPVSTFDLVVGIFIQFAGPSDMPQLFDGMKQALKPGGTLMLEGYRPDQLAYDTGGPPTADSMYTEDMLRNAFSDMRIVGLDSYDAVLNEGVAHSGMSALIDLVAIKPS